MPETIPELVTVQDIMALGMSPIYSEAYLRALCGDGLTMLQVWPGTYQYPNGCGWLPNYSHLGCALQCAPDLLSA